VLSIKDGGVINIGYLRSHCREERLSFNCSDDFTSQSKSDLLEINIGVFVQKTTSTAQFLKDFEIQRLPDILFR